MHMGRSHMHMGRLGAPGSGNLAIGADRQDSCTKAPCRRCVNRADFSSRSSPGLSEGDLTQKLRVTHKLSELIQ
jgi:hypothetical protein